MWEALAYLWDLKVLKCLDLVIKSNTTLRAVLRPSAGCFHLYIQHTHLLCYGDVLFLDSMKKEYNNITWPYIRPTVKDGEMKKN
jgi:hypothetical protein